MCAKVTKGVGKIHIECGLNFQRNSKLGVACLNFNKRHGVAQSPQLTQLTRGGGVLTASGCTGVEEDGGLLAGAGAGGVLVVEANQAKKDSRSSGENSSSASLAAACGA